MSLSDINIKAIKNRLRLKKPEEYKTTTKKAQPVVIPSPLDEKKDFISSLNELFEIELIAIDEITLSEDTKYLFDEIAGKYEYEGGLSRAEAEERTYNELFKIKIL